MANPDACQLYIKQEIEDGLAQGKTPGAISRELAAMIERLFETNIPPRTLEQRARRTQNATNVALPVTTEYPRENLEKQEYQEVSSGSQPGPGRAAKYAPAKAASKSVFNRTNDQIEWASWTWNPIVGCKHGCSYCYAADIVARFGNGRRFDDPQFLPNRLSAPKNTLVPISTNPGDSNVFVCSMADMFGEWVPQEWIDAILDEVKAAPQWNFLFLTKNPSRLVGIRWPDNAWVGTTVDIQARVSAAETAFSKIKAAVKFLSCEPLLEPLRFKNLKVFDWVIIGGCSQKGGAPAKQPDWRWLIDLECHALKAGCLIYEKPNLLVRAKEFPKIKEAS